MEADTYSILGPNEQNNLSLSDNLARRHQKYCSILEVTSDNNEQHTNVSKELFEIRDDDDYGTGEDEFDCSFKEQAIKFSAEALH